MRWHHINRLIKKYDCKSYLEIGVQKMLNFDHIECEYKKGVDPAVTHSQVFRQTSDDFFKMNMRFDCVFVDGLHHASQVERDIVNSVNSGAKVVILHDCLPPNFQSQVTPRISRIWTGDVWRAFVGFRGAYPQIETYCINDDYGLGVIIPNGEKVLPGFVSEIPYTEFDKNKKQLLNIL